MLCFYAGLGYNAELSIGFDFLVARFKAKIPEPGASAVESSM